jgi:serine/threonine-protein kinase
LKGFQWCPHCKSPHTLAEKFCPLTGKAMDRVIHREVANDAPLELGATVDDKYRIREFLGRGGKGMVFGAQRLVDGRAVAIKVARSFDQEAVVRLEREALVLSSLRHPNICAVYDAGFIPGVGTYMVMERLYGETLSHRIRSSGQMKLGEALLLVYQVLSALEFAHHNRVVHRDVKPSNVFVTQRAGAPPIAKLLDFGFAKRLKDAKTPLTKPGTAVGTPAYMAPEIVRVGDATPATDIFACGVVLFEALTGVLPWEGVTLREVRSAILAGRRRSLLDVIPDAPRPLSALVDSALASNPADRPASARAMQLALREIARRIIRGGGARPRRARAPGLARSDELSASSSSG